VLFGGEPLKGGDDIVAVFLASDHNTEKQAEWWVLNTARLCILLNLRGEETVLIASGFG
jgi:hypothetical protein